MYMCTRVLYRVFFVCVQLMYGSKGGRTVTGCVIYVCLQVCPPQPPSNKEDFPCPATPMSVLPPPDAFDYDLMVETLRKLKEGKMVEVPVYDFNTHSRAKYTVSYNDIHRYSK